MFPVFSNWKDEVKLRCGIEPILDASRGELLDLRDSEMCKEG